MSFKEIFPQRLKMARTMRGLSLRELAAGLEFSHNTIHKYESGKAFPSSEGLIKLARFLGQPIDFFLILSQYHWKKLNSAKKVLWGKRRLPGFKMRR